MTKSTKIFLGIATLWPFLYSIVFFIFFISLFLFMPESGGEESGPPFAFVVLIALHLFTMVWIVGLTVFYIVNIFKNDRVDKDKKVLWAVVIFMGSIIAMPIYWYLYIWKELPAGSLPAQASLGGAETSDWARAPIREQSVPPTQPPDWR